MRTLIILLIIAGIIAALYFLVMAAVAKVSIQPSFRSVDLKGISLDNIFTGNSTVKVGIDAKLVNRNGFPIRFSDFHIWIYYNGVLMAQTADTNNNLAKITMPAMGTIDVVHDVTLYLNAQILQMLKDLKNGKELRFDYTTEIKVFGFRYPYKDYFTYKM